MVKADGTIPFLSIKGAIQQFSGNELPFQGAEVALAKYGAQDTKGSVYQGVFSSPEMEPFELSVSPSVEASLRREGQSRAKGALASRILECCISRVLECFV